MVLHQSPIFGPVSSRRLGVSLGINLLPADGKACSFDCVYCECGLNAEHRTHTPLPTRRQVREALEMRLCQMRQNGDRLDVLTFAGNGEPTLHPQFSEIADDVIVLRSRYFPEAKISVLSNSTQIHRPEVLETLCRLDSPIMKLDTVSPEYISLVDRPQGRYDVEEIIGILSSVGRKVIIQTMFLCGTVYGKSVDNTGEEYVEPWLWAIQKINPKQVMAYTIARETPVKTLLKAPPQRLDRIAQRVEELGINCSVSY